MSRLRTGAKTDRGGGPAVPSSTIAWAVWIKKHRKYTGGQGDWTVSAKWIPIVAHGLYHISIIMAYRQDEAVKDCRLQVKSGQPIYDFVSDDGIGHRVWVIKDRGNGPLQDAFERIPGQPIL